ncbi:MAG: hypothetical protein EBX36_10265 [Planctomycetia bacterium]|nr:hypothetical protein [Planctomycetia bacterium]
MSSSYAQSIDSTSGWDRSSVRPACTSARTPSARDSLQPSPPTSTASQSWASSSGCQAASRGTVGPTKRTSGPVSGRSQPITTVSPWRGAAATTSAIRASMPSSPSFMAPLFAGDPHPASPGL